MRGNIVSPGRQLKGWLRVTSRSGGPCMGGAAQVDLLVGPRGTAPGSVYSDGHRVRMPLVLPGQVSPRSGNVAVRKGARVVATSPVRRPPAVFTRRADSDLASRTHGVTVRSGRK